MDSPTFLSFNYNRRFGAEIEINSFDQRDFKKYPLGRGELPEGIEYVAEVCQKVVRTPVDIMKWHHTHNNLTWRVKPDSSCGIELCSPVVKGWPGLKEICKVVEALGQDDRIKIDDRCSFHCHVEVADCTQDQLASILTYWIKCESVFLDSVPANRKRNRFCQCIGLSDLFEHDTEVNSEEVIRRLGMMKYYTLNTFHQCKGNRDTIEFRIIESEGCTDAYLVKNWIRLLIHFVEMAKAQPRPRQYYPGDPWSSFLWLDPNQVMEFLGFINDGYELSKGMTQTRDWFLARLHKNTFDTGLPGIWSNVARKVAKDQVDNIIKSLGFNDAAMKHCLQNPDALYSPAYKF